MLHETSAREALAEMRQGRSTEEYIALVWASRYPHPMPAASGGWPYSLARGWLRCLARLERLNNVQARAITCRARYWAANRC
jgi:hypothetical protein